ncbi:MAG TPA: SOS response-associated peptidase [Gemmatimonadaceae bacterium]|nr:SOS response-associated peptidase [Gemmatimonadaceae bacterium]
MCGRSTRCSKVEIEGFTMTFKPYQLDRTLFEPSFNVAPSQPQLVLLRDDRGVAGRGMKWGLVPAGDHGRARTALVNARAETADVMPLVRDAFRHRRCVIVADGFYEWRKDGKSRQPFFLRLKGGRAFGFAGLWERNESGDETCTLLTTRPNELVAPVHNRMPCILDREPAARWLDAATGSDRLKEMLLPIAAAGMECWPVSTFVNSPANDGPECIVIAAAIAD